MEPINTINTIETDSTKIAVINNNISFIQRDVANINLSLKELATVYVTRDNLAEIAKQTEVRISALEKSNNLWKWLSPTISAVIAVIIEYLFIFYLQHIK